MDQEGLTLLNLGQSLDDIANIDPRGYGVCKILYKGSREFTGKPLSLNAAQKLCSTIKKDDIVLIMTGFVLLPFGTPETDGIVSSMLLARSLVIAFEAKPVLVCPAENLPAVKKMAATVGLHLYEDIEELKKMPVSCGVITFTKDRTAAPAMADKIIAQCSPSAVITIECPGENEKGCYHNATGLDITKLEAKSNVLFDKLKAAGVLTLSVGDLGNEMGMGAIREHLLRYIPYAAPGSCRCECKGGIAVRTAAYNIITATVSDWGVYALIAMLAYLKNDLNIMHDGELEKRTLTAACESGMIDMYGWLIPAIDGFGLDFEVPIVSLMRSCVEQSLALKEKCSVWFDKVGKLGFFDSNK